MKNVLLFIVVCALSGPSILAGSVLGNAFGKPVLFVGAVLGGIAGIAVALLVANRFGLLAGARYIIVLGAALIGFAIAAVIAVLDLSGPVIPISSVALIGIAAVIGKAMSAE